MVGRRLAKRPNHIAAHLPCQFWRYDVAMAAPDDWFPTMFWI
jgi:hypothetical protein